jgi:hypothetical protein
MIRFDAPDNKYTIAGDYKNLDGLNYLEGKTLDFVDEQAYRGTLDAHVDGGVPVITMEAGELNGAKLGELEVKVDAANQGLVGTVRSVNGVAADAAGNVALGKGVYITETWSSGTSWYRKWGDGFIEQGGRAKCNTLTTFPTAFATTIYTFTHSTIGLQHTHLEFCDRVTKTGFTLKQGTNAASPNYDSYWYACGY